MKAEMFVSFRKSTSGRVIPQEMTSTEFHPANGVKVVKVVVEFPDGFFDIPEFTAHALEVDVEQAVKDLKALEGELS